MSRLLGDNHAEVLDGMRLDAEARRDADRHVWSQLLPDRVATVTVHAAALHPTPCSPIYATPARARWCTKGGVCYNGV